MKLIAEDGKELQRSDLTPEGGLIDPKKNLRAGILGTILFLEQLAVEDTNMTFRREARIQADTLRGMLRRARGGRDDVIEDAITSEVQRFLDGRKALPAPTRRLAHDSDVIDV